MTAKHAQITAFRVTDMGDALAFYEGVLGFSKDWMWQHEENFPYFASVSRNQHTLYLTEHPECETGGLVYLYLETPDDVNAYHDVIIKNGGKADFGPVDQPWKLRELQITDPFGNKIRFVGQLLD